MLSDREKAAYTEATERAPELIDSESDPLRFLRCAKYNAWAAARHLARYWEKRLVLFGTRAFLPMTKTGDGTLSEEDVRLLESGYLSFLPDDKEGNPVVCYDDSRVPHDLGDPEGLSRLRCLFYTLSVVSERRKASLDGFVGIEIMNTQRFDYSESCFADLVATAMPVYLKALHLVHFPADDAGKNKLLQTIVPNTLKLLGASAFEWTHIHTGSTQEEILDKMQNFGFSPDKLPMRLGGTWASVPFASLSNTLGASPVASSTYPLATALALGEVRLCGAASEKTQTVSSIYSKRKRERKKQRIDDLEEEKSLLRELNGRLRVDNEKLEVLIIKADKAVLEHQMTTLQRIEPGGITRFTNPPSSVLPARLEPALGGRSSAPHATTGTTLSSPRTIENHVIDGLVRDVMNQHTLNATRAGLSQAQNRAHQYSQHEQYIAAAVAGSLGFASDRVHPTVAGTHSVQHSTRNDTGGSLNAQELLALAALLAPPTRGASHTPVEPQQQQQPVDLSRLGFLWNRNR